MGIASTIGGGRGGALSLNLAGATQPTRFIGSTTTGAPASGTFAVGDFCVAADGHIFVCTVAGTPGTWVDAGSVANQVTSVFTRTGAVVATSGDYTAAQVTNAADKSSASQQTFTGNVSSPAYIAAGITGATSASRYVGATASGAPASGTFAVGDFVIDRAGSLWVCTSAGTPGTWAQVTAAALASGALTNAMVNGSAAIAYSKLNLANSIVTGDIVDGTIVNGDISGSAAIAYSKLNLANSIVTGDIVDGTIVNGDISGSAAIAYSKLNLASSIVTGDIVDGTILNADINASAAIDSTKLSFPAFTSYGVTWTSTGTQPALGNGTLVGRSVTIGKSVRAWVVLTMGSTTTYGTGNYIFSLPATVHASTPTNFVYGVGAVTRSSVYPVVPMSGSGAVVLGIPAQPIGSFVGPTVPATFVSGDVIYFNIMYEAA